VATFTKFESFVEALAEKKHDLGADTLKVMLTLTAPIASNSVKANLTEIAAGNGYTAGGTAAAITSSAQTSGTYKLVLGDVTFTASGGSIANFRYAVLYNDTAANDELIGFWDSGGTQTITTGNSFVWDADPSTGILTIA
jgi:hypothetical protein